MMWKIKSWWRNFWRERKRYKDFVIQLKKEQSLDRSKRVVYIQYDEYPMQEGMLPEGWVTQVPKETGKHFHDYEWPNEKES
jgi:hypothetical protein